MPYISPPVTCLVELPSFSAFNHSVLQEVQYRYGTRLVEMPSFSAFGDSGCSIIYEVVFKLILISVRKHPTDSYKQVYQKVQGFEVIIHARYLRYCFVF